MLPDCEMKPMSPALTLASASRFTFFVKIEHARGVGTDDAHAAGARRVQHLLLELQALRSRFAETAGEDDGPFTPSCRIRRAAPAPSRPGTDQARSIGPGTSASEAQVLTPRIMSTFGLIG